MAFDETWLRIREFEGEYGRDWVRRPDPVTILTIPAPLAEKAARFEDGAWQFLERIVGEWTTRWPLRPLAKPAREILKKPRALPYGGWTYVPEDCTVVYRPRLLEDAWQETAGEMCPRLWALSGSEAARLYIYYCYTHEILDGRVLSPAETLEAFRCAEEFRWPL